MDGAKVRREDELRNGRGLRAYIPQGRRRSVSTSCEVPVRSVEPLVISSVAGMRAVETRMPCIARAAAIAVLTAGSLHSEAEQDLAGGDVAS